MPNSGDSCALPLTVEQDNIGLAGIPCTNGSAALGGWIPQFDATVATRIMDAGGIITGKAGQSVGAWPGVLRR